MTQVGGFFYHSIQLYLKGRTYKPKFIVARFPGFTMESKRIIHFS